MLFGGWLIFAACNAVAMLALSDQETIPFHLIWISLSVVYGLQVWNRRTMALVLTAVTAFSTYAISRSVLKGMVDWQELTEIPLMAVVFLAMVWHVQRRMAALRQAEVRGESERRAHEVKELFVRHCSHEMRTPLTVARGYTELVRSDVSAHRSQEDLDVVLGELSTLDELARRLVTLAEAYRSNEFEMEPLDLADVVEHTVQRWRAAADREWQVIGRPVLVQGDGARLETALDTVIENAVKFTVPGDRIVLRCHRRGTAAVLEVEDAGLGLASSALAAGPPYSSGKPGTGLGLSIVQAIVDGHHGSVEMLDAPTRGTVVRLRFPALVTGADTRNYVTTGSVELVRAATVGLPSDAVLQ